MYSIKQLTDIDISLAEEEQKYINNPLNPSTLISKTYKILSSNILKSDKVSKIGYCCEVKGINYPIFLTINNVEKEFYIGKTGMFEFQPENWKNVNDPESEEIQVEVYVSQIKVPDDIKFVLDYCYSL